MKKGKISKDDIERIIMLTEINKFTWIHDKKNRLYYTSLTDITLLNNQVLCEKTIGKNIRGCSIYHTLENKTWYYIFLLPYAIEKRMGIRNNKLEATSKMFVAINTLFDLIKAKYKT